MANRILIEGGKPLVGEVPISGMKNAALPIVFATVLVGGVSVLENIPPISDITIALDILRQMGASVSFSDRTTVRIDTSALLPGTSPDALVSRIRGSSYLAGAELGRFGARGLRASGAAVTSAAPARWICISRALRRSAQRCGAETGCRRMPPTVCTARRSISTKARSAPP